MAHAPRLIGVETELGFAALDRQGRRGPSEPFLTEIEENVRQHNVYLPHVSGRGIFASNGGRLYRDNSGPHGLLETCTPECVTPWEIVAQVKASHRLVADAVDRLNERPSHPLTGHLFSHSTDLGGDGNSMASHENYSANRPVGHQPYEFIPFLVSRVIFTGAGGFRANASGVEFMLSPRVQHISQEVSDHTASRRPVYCDRDKAFQTGGVYRVHIICGESTASETSSFLKYATTALVVAMVDGGVTPGTGVRLKNPVAAMKRFADDPSCSTACECTDGKKRTAIQIQRHYLCFALKHRRQSFMPKWTGSVCAMWGRMLDRLEDAPDSVDRSLDWAIKLKMCQAHVRSQGFEWDELPKWYYLLQQCEGEPLDPFHPGLSMAGQLARIMNTIDRRFALPYEPALCAEQLKKLRPLRADLFQLNIRYHQLNKGMNLFEHLDEAGLLDHRVEGVGDYREAMHTPPAGGRARIRGEFITKHGQTERDRARYTCGWSKIRDLVEGRRLDTSYPYETEPRWVEETPAGESRPVRRRPFFEPVPCRPPYLDPARERYARGEWGQAFRTLEEGTATGDDDGDYRDDVLRLKALALARMGRSEALDHIQRWRDNQPLSYDSISDQMYVLRFLGLAPRPEIQAWIHMGLHRALPDTRLNGSAIQFNEHWAAWMSCKGQYDEAGFLFEETIQQYRASQDHPRLARALATRANVQRILGESNRARRALDEACSIFGEVGDFGNYAELVLLNRAKLEAADNPGAAMEHVKSGTAFLKDERYGAEVALVKALLIQVRIESDGERTAPIRQEIMTRREGSRALRGCPRLDAILEQWDSWVEGAKLFRNDLFWGL